MANTGNKASPKSRDRVSSKPQDPASSEVRAVEARDSRKGASKDSQHDNSPEPLKSQWFHILLSLADQDLHGTAIMEEVLERTDGAIRLWPGTLYGALGDLSDRDLIREVHPPEDAPTEGGKRRFYAITPRGKQALAREVARLEEILHVARTRGIGKDLSRA